MLKKCLPAGRVVCAVVFCAGLLMCAPGRASALESVQIGWDASDSTDVVSYNLYCSQPDGTVSKLVMGDVTTATVSNLVDGATYYFYLTASDGAGLESAPSAQIAYTVPVPVVLQMQPVQDGSGTALSITAMGDIPAQWVLECSTNLQDWATCATGTNTAVNIQVSTATAPQNFYRLRSL